MGLGRVSSCSGKQKSTTTIGRLESDRKMWKLSAKSGRIGSYVHFQNAQTNKHIHAIVISKTIIQEYLGLPVG